MVSLLLFVLNLLFKSRFGVLEVFTPKFLFELIFKLDSLHHGYELLPLFDLVLLD